LPEGYKMNPLAPMAYLIEGLAETGPVDRGALKRPSRIDKPAAEVEIPLSVTMPSGDDLIKLSLNYYYCREGAEGLCKTGSVAWTVPLKLSAEATSSTVRCEFDVK